jgi:hypothetical protein
MSHVIFSGPSARSNSLLDSSKFILSVQARLQFWLLIRCQPGTPACQANKLSRTYAVLLDALNRYRGKEGQQKVTVEHVDVHAGGQAVVGIVESPRGGDQPKSEDQPHAKQIAPAEDRLAFTTA